MMQRSSRCSLVVLVALATSGCSSAPSSVVQLSDNLVMLETESPIQAGLSPQIRFEAPTGVDSMLIEVSGGTGLYYLSGLVSPSGRDLVESGQLITREAREIEGYVSWMLPMADPIPFGPGGYELLIRGETTSGERLGEGNIDVRIYLNGRPAAQSCRLDVDFLVADDAIVGGATDGAVARLASRISELLGQSDIQIEDYGISRIDFPTVLVEEGYRGADLAQAARAVGTRLTDALAAGQARRDALHVFIVRDLGGSTRGYSLGLPGPLSGDWPSAGVLVSTSAFVGEDGLLDPEQMATTVAHEMGHYLGLLHTTEFDGLIHDPLDDTPECDFQLSCGDQPDFSENLMTPGGNPDRNVLTPSQGLVMRRHPLCH